jgi:hypothetical protein
MTQILPQVGDVLRRSRIEGMTLFLPPEQIDRALYVAVNDVLSRLGGKWDRKTKGHVFKADPAQTLATVLETGRKPRREDANPLDFFPTPPTVVEQMIWRANLCNDIAVLEPSAGKGAIAVPLHHSRLRLTVTCIELDPARAEILRSLGLCVHEENFLAYQQKGYDRILMNPPFTASSDPLAYIAHVEHAYSLLRPGGRLVSIAPGGLAFRDDRRTAALRRRITACGGWEELPAGAFGASGTEVRTVMLWMAA